MNTDYGRRADGTPSDALLVQRTLAGEVDAYNVLVTRYQRQVYSLIYRMVAHTDDASDLLQETFIRAYGALQTFRQDASFLTWLYKIASNLSIDLMRSRRTRSAASLEEELESGREPVDGNREGDPECMVVRDAVGGLVHREVMSLPARYRQVVVLRHMRGMSIDEIAAELGLPSGTVKTHLFRARHMLRERLQPVLGVRDDGTEEAV